MMMVQILIWLFVSGIFATAAAQKLPRKWSQGDRDSGSIPWTYDGWSSLEPSGEELSPSKWSTAYPFCGGSRQSPILLPLNNVRAEGKMRLSNLNLVDYDEFPINKTWTITNNGHTVQINADFITPPQLQRGNLPAKYVFKQIHVHWGSNKEHGSEHHVDDKQYPLEMHLVHYMKGVTTAYAEANSTGLAVLGVFFEITTGASDPAVDEFFNALQYVKFKGIATATMQHFTLDKLLPNNLSYMRYLGSLTTPPCSETVVWTMLTTPMKVTTSQLEILRSLHRTEKTTGQAKSGSAFIVNNYRPLQHLNHRTVTYHNDLQC